MRRIVVLGQLPNSSDEQVAILAVRLDRGEPLAARVQRTSQLTLFVFARREYGPVRPEENIIGPILGFS